MEEAEKSKIETIKQIETSKEDADSCKRDEKNLKIETPPKFIPE